MKEFMFVFRRDTKAGNDISPEQMQALTKKWQEWGAFLQSHNHTVANGNRLATEGKVVRPKNIVTDGPFVEIKEAIAGYMIVRSKDVDGAVELAKNCPILSMNGSVEIREFVGADGRS